MKDPFPEPGERWGYFYSFTNRPPLLPSAGQIYMQHNQERKNIRPQGGKFSWLIRKPLADVHVFKRTTRRRGGGGRQKNACEAENKWVMIQLCLVYTDCSW